MKIKSKLEAAPYFWDSLIYFIKRSRIPRSLLRE